MQEHDDIFVAGEWSRAHGAGRQLVLDPATEEAWASVPTSDAALYNRALAFRTPSSEVGSAPIIICVD